jgi:hypothetical protein
MKEKEKQIELELPIRLSSESEGVFIEQDGPLYGPESPEASDFGGQMDAETYQILWEDRIATGG